MELKEAFEFCKFVHVQRKENQKADELATKALDSSEKLLLH